MAIENPLWDKLRTEEIDANDQQLFLSILLKGLIFNLNKTIKIRQLGVPHYILNTGDDIFYLEVKGQNHAIEPQQNSNEDFVYNIIPRCLVQPAGLDIQTDQLTSPYTNGRFTFEHDDIQYDFTAEYRRMPLKLAVSLKYITDNFTDALQATQQILSKLAFINLFTIVYLGRTINCSYSIPSSVNMEHNIEFDGLTSDSKNCSMDIEIEVDTNFPVINPRTLMPADAYIKQMVVNNDADITTQKAIDTITGPAVDHYIYDKDGHKIGVGSGITLYPHGGLKIENEDNW